MSTEGVAQATQRDAMFFLTILNNMRNKPDVNWEVVARICNYSNANTAKVRFGQIKKKLGCADDNGSSPAKATKTPKSANGTPTKPRVKKNSNEGGTAISPSKVSKSGGGRQKAKFSKSQIANAVMNHMDEVEVRTEGKRRATVQAEVGADDDEYDEGEEMSFLKEEVEDPYGNGDGDEFYEG